MELIWNSKNKNIIKETSKLLNLIEDNQSDNHFIEGDNLDVLLLLDKFKKKIKFIYIDPPYNTGNQFVYGDNANMDEWLNNIYVRLKLSKEYLADDGYIFISINEDNMPYIKIMMDEIYGKDKFITNFVWLNSLSDEIDETTKFGGSNSGTLKKSYENILLYSLSKNKKIILDESDEPYIIKLITKGGTNHNELIIPIGIKNIDSNFNGIIKGKVGKEKDFYFILNEEGMIFEKGILMNEVKIKGPLANPNLLKKWFSGEKTFDSKGQELIDVFISKTGMLHTKKIRNGNVVSNVINGKGSAKSATLYLEKEFGIKFFNYAKPFELIQYLIQKVIGKNENIMIMDFYAGSGTTAEAVLKLNEKGYQLNWILVQLDEPIKEINKNKDIIKYLNERKLDLNISSLTKIRLDKLKEKYKCNYNYYKLK